MRSRTPVRGLAVVCAATVCLLASEAGAATLTVAAGGDLQAALNAAQPGDTIVLQAGATFVGNFVLPNKGVASDYITVRSSTPDSSLPPSGVRMTPGYASLLAKIKSPNTAPALRTATAANHWKLMFLEFQANQDGYYDLLLLGAGDASQTQLSQMPYALVLDRLYVHGDPVLGQKRCISLHSSDTTIVNSYISDCKAVGQDAQAIAGYNGSGNYLIENNYIEGAAENFLLGGSDPLISNLVTTNVVFRRNYVTKPLAWRNAVVNTPVGVAAAPVAGGGSLPAGVYYYKVEARSASSQGAKPNSAASVEVAATLSVPGGVTVSWSPVAGAVDYLVYGRTAGSENTYWVTTSPYFTDAGAGGSSGTPAKASTWTVKNAFELKNAQDVTVEGNVFENVWVAGQTGYAVLFTPRNQNGTAPWVVVQRITFQDNIVRHAAGGINILGSDDANPSQLTNHITIRDNVFDDISKTWGSGAADFLIGAGPDSVTIDHNTIVTNDNAIVSLYGGTATSPMPIPNFAYSNNMSPHDAYGIIGANFGIGTSSINAYLPGSVVARDVLAGGTASQYPAGNYFPSVASWQAEFTNYAGGDYHLLSTSIYKGVGTDGADLGANIDAVSAETATATSGDDRQAQATTSNIRILTTALPNGLVGQTYSQTLACTGAASGCMWQLTGGTLPAGLALDGSSGAVAGVPTTPQTSTLTVAAYDPTMPSNSTSITLSLTIDPPPLVVTVPSAPQGQVGVPYLLTPSVSGVVGSATWSIASGTLPPGIGIDPTSGVLSGVPTGWGTSTGLVQAQDSWTSDGTPRTDSKPVSITIAPAPLVITTTSLPDGTYQSAYTAVLSTTGGTGSVAWVVSAGALPSGITLSSNGTLSGVASQAGTFAFTVLASDMNWAGNQASQALSIVIQPPPFTIAVPPPPVGVVGTPYSVIATASGQLGSVTWSIASGSLPPGLTLNSSTGAIAGVPTAYSTFSALIQARDSATARTAQAAVAITIAPSAIAVATTSLPSATFASTYQAALTATGGTGSTTWSIVSGTLPSGLSLATNGVISGTAAAVGTATFTVQAVDTAWPGNVASRSLSIAVTMREIVLYAARATTVAGTWSVVADATAAGGSRIWNPDKGAAKVSSPAASPANYFELSFQAEAGVPYHLWMRGKADNDSYLNDSAYVQFSGTVDTSGAPVYRIGTTSATTYTVEQGTGAGVAGWGWSDNAYDALAAPLYFATSGLQTIRIQVREDGLSLDQIVLSAAKYTTTAPGAAKNDTTILPATPTTVSSATSAATSASSILEVVMYAAEAPVIAGTWSVVSDASAAGGLRIWNPDYGAAKLATPLASPANYFELTFQVTAGVPYHLWMRGRADADYYGNDSVYVQFSGTVDATGAPLYRIGTTSATPLMIEQGTGAGLSGWGWADNAYDALAAPLYFAASGTQTIRVQVREDGLSLDQIVLSADKYATTAPGAPKDDTTILPK